VVAHSRTAPLVEGISVVDRCVYVDHVPMPRLLATLRFDALFFPRPRADEAWCAWWHRVRLRIGSAYRWWSPLYNVRIADHRSTAQFHEAAYNVRMLEHITGRSYEVALVPPVVQESARRVVRDRIAEAGIGDCDRFIVLHPGGRGSAPRWKKFPALAALLTAAIGDRHIVVTGTAAEAAECAAIIDHVPRAVNLCGALSLAELVALIASADLLVANSTGVLHIAAALGIPVVGLFPSEPPALSPARWGPLGKSASVLSATPIDVIEPQQVAQAVCQRLALV